MSAAGSKLRRAEGRFFHWCPACELRHPLPYSWTFNGDLERPTFSPSFRQTLGDGGVCHYFIIAGEIHFVADSTHALAGQRVQLPDMPGDLFDAQERRE